MDLRAYYRKVREAESTMPDPFVIVVSTETPDGGKAGVLSEVTRHSAARQIAESRCRVATEEEADTFRKVNAETKRLADEAAALNRVQLVLAPSRPGMKGLRDQG